MLAGADFGTLSCLQTARERIARLGEPHSHVMLTEQRRRRIECKFEGVKTCDCAMQLGLDPWLHSFAHAGARAVR